MKKLLAASAVFMLYACGTKPEISNSPSSVKASSELMATLPAPYNAFGNPTPGGVCGFEPVQLEGDSGVGIAGWAIIDAKAGVLPEKVILAIKSQDNTSYSLTQSTERTDVAKHFNNPRLSRSGFKQSLSIKGDMRPATVSALLAFNNKLYKCSADLAIQR